MGNGYNHHHLHQQHRSNFLPMLCSRPSSLKDVHLPKSNSNSSSSSTFKDPSSPRVSCIGQVKRNNRVNGFPPPYRSFITTTTNTNNNIKYHKLKKLFSGKNLTTTTTISSADRRSEMKRASGAKISSNNDDAINYVNLAELDPPLPVVKRVVQQCPAEGRDEVNLWKRRSGGLKSLQLQQIHIPNSNTNNIYHCNSVTTTQFLPTTV